MMASTVARALLSAALAMALLAASGCDDSGPSELEPPEREAVPNTVYAPASSEVEVARNEYQDFKITDAAVPEYEVIWRRQDAADAIGPRYRYFPARYGVDTLTAYVTYPERDLQYQHPWRVQVPYPEATVIFLPAETGLATIRDAAYPLRARSDHPELSEYRWLRDGAAVGTDSVYVYDEPADGSTVVRCEVTVGEAVHEHEWNIETRLLEEIPVPPVPDVAVVPGSRYAELRVIWRDHDYWFLPFEEYEVLLSAEGPITAANRSGASVMATVPPDESGTYSRSFYAPDDERLDPGANVWFAVVARDESGRESDPGEELSSRVPEYWYIEGRVSGAWDSPLEYAEVYDSERPFSVRTDADGRYRIGPYAETHTVTLVATADDIESEYGYYETASSPQTLDGERVYDFALIPLYGTDPGCPELPDFLKFLRHATKTTSEVSDELDFILRRWQEYPLKVYVPDHVTSGGYDTGRVSRTAVEIWNTRMGEQYLVLVDDPAEAQIEFVLDEQSDSAYGQTLVVDPPEAAGQAQGYIPKRKNVYIFENKVVSEDRAERTAAHELGHALGIHAHLPCSGPDYLMYYTPSIPDDRWPEHAVHPDEVHVVRTIRYLPQNTDMSLFR